MGTFFPSILRTMDFQSVDFVPRHLFHSSARFFVVSPISFEDELFARPQVLNFSSTSRDLLDFERVREIFWILVCFMIRCCAAVPRVFRVQFAVISFLTSIPVEVEERNDCLDRSVPQKPCRTDFQTVQVSNEGTEVPQKFPEFGIRTGGGPELVTRNL